MSADAKGKKLDNPAEDEVESLFSGGWQPDSNASDNSDETEPGDSQEVEIQSPVEKAVESSPEKPVKICPKCSFKNTNFFNCDRCGLIFSKWRPDSGSAVLNEIAPGIIDQASLLWREFSEGEKNAAALENFHKFCINNNASSFAANSYRSWLSDHPDDPEVRELQQKLVNQAMLLLVRPAKEERAVSNRTLIFALGGAIFLTILFAMFFSNIFENLR